MEFAANLMQEIMDGLGNVSAYVRSVSDGRLLFVSRKLLDDIGYKGDYHGRLLPELFIDRAFAECFDADISLLDAGSTERRCEYAGKSYLNKDFLITWEGGVKAHFHSCRDITQEIAEQHVLENAKSEAEKAGQAKTEFLSRMSHEIRTPLNAILGFTRIASLSGDPEKTKQYLAKIELSGTQLLNIINDVLDMSKISANKMQLVYEPLNLEKTLINITNVISVKVLEKKQELHVNMNLDVPVNVYGDGFRITQVLTNLLSNAVKFTPEGGRIRIEVKLLESAGKKCRVEFQVWDNGIGIPEDSSRLFTSFEQSDGSIARKFGGTGLGLSICKSLVEMMGGEISARRRKSGGSVFSFDVPFEIVEGAAARELAKKIDLNKLHVMLVDDNKDTCEYFKHMMSGFRISCDYAATCKEAANKLRKYALEPDECDFNIVFMVMPSTKDEMTGMMEVLKTANADAVVMISGGGEAEEEQARMFGVKYFITKPLFPSAVLDAIHDIAGISQKVMQIVKTSDYDFKGKRLLLAEDVAINSEIVVQELSHTGIDIDVAENGEIAVNMFAKNPSAYDLIFMDLHMPVMDGLDATRAIRKLMVPNAKTIPIIAMTASAFREDIQKCLDAGMNDHIAKPVEPNTVLYKINYYTGGNQTAKRSSGAYKKQAADSAAPAAPAAAGFGDDVVADGERLSDEAVAECVNVSEGLARLKGNVKIYKTLLGSYLKSVYITQLSEEIAAGNREKAAGTAHAIKGVAANLSLPLLYNNVFLLEQQLKSGFDYSETFKTVTENDKLTKACVRQVINTL